jgi:hypothetical protein
MDSRKQFIAKHSDQYLQQVKMLMAELGQCAVGDIQTNRARQHPNEVDPRRPLIEPINFRQYFQRHAWRR